VLSAVIAPIVMLHQTAAVCAVLAGRDCGWKSPEFTAIAPPQGLPEAIAGLTLISLVMLTNPAGMIWLVPMAGPMIAAPLLIRWLNTPKPQVIPA
jgi:membrane glycosyltransferase